METTTQIMREAPDIEAYKLGLLKSAKAQAEAKVDLPAYQVQDLTKDQLDAMALGRQGIGAYQPYLEGGAQAVRAGTGALGEAADILRGADTRGQFTAAQNAYNLAAQPAAALGNLSNVAGAGMGYLSGAGQDFDYAQKMALASSQANLDPAQMMMLNSVNQAQAAAPQFNYAQQMIGAGAAAGQQAVRGAENLSQQGIGTLYDAAARAQQAASSLGAAPRVENVPKMDATTMRTAQTEYSPDIQSFKMDPAQQVTTQSFATPGSADAFMSPYMQSVVQAQQREARRVSDVQQQAEQAQAARSGAFGGSRQGILQAERSRNLSRQLGDIQASGLQSAYQQAQQQFNTEQQARLAAQQANQQAGLTVGAQNLGSQQSAQQLQTQTGLQTALANLSSEQQANVNNQAAEMQARGMNAQQALQTALTNQQTAAQYGIQGAQLGLQGAEALRQAGIGTLSAAGQQGQLGLQGASQLGQAGGQLGALEGQRATQAMQAAQYGGNVAQQLASQELQQAQLGQGAANLYGSIAGQQAGLAGQTANIAGQQANILGQQSQLQQQLGQGIGNLAAQQFGVGQNMAAGLGALGTQAANAGIQQAQLGQAAQSMGQQDVSALSAIGAQEQKQGQAELDAVRASKMQEVMQPYQQLAFVSDIYKGAPSTQMSVTQQQTPAPSAFQQIAGLGTGILGTAAAANAASKLF